MGDERSSDPLLQLYADVGDLAVISVGYRLAPEHPYPAPVEDCFDAAGWLVENSQDKFGGPVKFFTGEVCFLLHFRFHDSWYIPYESTHRRETLVVGLLRHTCYRKFGST